VSTSKNESRTRDVPVADLGQAAGEDPGPDAPVARQLVPDDDFDRIFAAGVTAAGESDRPAGVHVPPEYPTGEVPAEFDVDSVFSLDPDDTADATDGERLEGRAGRPDEPEPLEDDAEQVRPEPTALPRLPR
jgi:hypothetical protein